MKIITFIGKILISSGLATVMSITMYILSLVLLAKMVDIFRLNKNGNPMWVLTVCMTILWLTWFLSFTYFIGGFQ